MEIREFAERIFYAEGLEEKCWRPEGGLLSLTDEAPGQAVSWRDPSRPPDAQITPKNKRRKMRWPHPDALHAPEMRIRCLHTFANHELMALEMMAWALLAFPDAPTAFRRGLANILCEEQDHFRLYCERLLAMGTRFGDLPLNDHFWRMAKDIHDPLKWVCTMHLTFEQANLDHAPQFAQHFARVGDDEAAALMQTIYEDEIKHVRFGGVWLKHYQRKQAETQSSFQLFTNNLSTYNSPTRAKGKDFNAEARRLAGLDEDFIQALQQHESL